MAKKANNLYKCILFSRCSAKAKVSGHTTQKCNNKKEVDLRLSGSQVSYLEIYMQKFES